MKFYIALRYRYNIIMMLEKKYHITMSFQSQFVIGLYATDVATIFRAHWVLNVYLEKSK